MTTSGDKLWTDAIVRAEIGYDPTVFDLDQLRTAIEDSSSGSCQSTCSACTSTPLCVKWGQL